MRNNSQKMKGNSNTSDVRIGCYNKVAPRTALKYSKDRGEGCGSAGWVNQCSVKRDFTWRKVSMKSSTSMSDLAFLTPFRSDSCSRVLLDISRIFCQCYDFWALGTSCARISFMTFPSLSLPKKGNPVKNDPCDKQKGKMMRRNITYLFLSECIMDEDQRH